MYTGQLIMSGMTAYSQWFSRSANGVKAVVELMGASSGGDVKVSLYTKNHDSPGGGAEISGSEVALGSAGFATITISPTSASGMKELVRFKMSASTPLEGVIAWAHFRILSPTWYDRA